VRRRGLACIAVFAACAIACASPRDACADGPRIGLVAPPASPFAARIRAEIEAMGFTVEPSDAIDASAAAGQVGAARVVETPPPRRVELWLRAPGGRGLALRTVIQSIPDEDEATETVRAAEQLRAFFQPLRAPPPAPAPVRPREPDLVGEPLPALIEPAPKSDAAQRFEAAAGVAAAIQSGGAGVDVALRFRWMATRVFGVGVTVDVPVMGSTVRSAEGSASLAAAVFAAEISAVLLDRRPVRLAVTGALAAAWLRTSGSAKAPYTGSTDDVATALPMLGVEVAPRVAQRVHLFAAGRAGVSFPRADVAFAGRTVATWGRPVGLASGGVSFDF
jgi:hypothetical protein